jgi:two-component system chemotaxis sensor kinase CheA
VSDDPISEFVTECLENLDRFEEGMLTLEREPTARAVLDDMFRAIHTIKGSSGFFDFNAVARVSHAGENLLSAMREGRMVATAQSVSLLLEMADVLRRLLTGGLAAGREPPSDDSDLIERLKIALRDGAASGAKGGGPPTSATSPPTDATTSPPHATADPPSAQVVLAVSATIVPTATEDAAAEVPDAPTDSPASPEPSASQAATPTEAAPTAQSPASRESAGEPSKTASKPGETASKPGATLRVDVEVVDRLMDLAGEIVLARNQILRLAASTADSAYLAAAQRLNVITSELQERVMKTRMQPIGTVWSKFPRLVRDVAKLCDKEVRLDFSGGETELDKSVVEAIKDPLTHLIRNSIDHGIESAAVRAAAGKPAEGVIMMRAYAQGGQVIIEIADDGGGIDQDKVLRRAVERGVITADEAAKLTPREILGLIFRPGFSTADAVSTVSGRGVGMDVVKTNLQKLGGLVDVDSVLGQGTTVRLTIPLTLAIVPALIVTCGGSRYAIPQSSLVELVNLRSGDNEHRIERIHESIVFRLRGDILPIIDLSRELQIQSARPPGASINVAVLEVSNGRFGLIVDDISDTVEIVVKPLAAQLHSIALFAGATILGDGSIALILDMPELARRAALREGSNRSTAQNVGRAAEHRIAAVVARIANGLQVAIPMDQITRLERIPRSRMEWGDGRRVVQYRGSLLWCLDLGEQLGISIASDDTREFADMIVVEAGEQPIGLIVEQVIDVVDLDTAGITPSSRPSYAGSAVVFGRVTDVVNLRMVLNSLGFYPEVADAA